MEQPRRSAEFIAGGIASCLQSASSTHACWEQLSPAQIQEFVSDIVAALEHRSADVHEQVIQLIAQHAILSPGWTALGATEARSLSTAIGNMVDEYR
jgi:hypothetical protein